ncbi:MAG: tail protein X [Xanthomonadaceae bacterium]|nr:tail protein X [Xanthomonadaceae bacterium]
MFLVHVTVDGERWDQIAYAYYGDPLGYERVIAANPDVALTPTLPAGLLLLVPLIEQAALTQGLPPWQTE